MLRAARANLYELACRKAIKGGGADLLARNPLLRTRLAQAFAGTSPPDAETLARLLLTAVILSPLAFIFLSDTVSLVAGIVMTVGLLGCTLPRELSHLIPGPATFLTGEMDAGHAYRGLRRPAGHEAEPG